ncbi:hypothetical protein [Roseateles amylovorans]|uniref:SPOR domain-containing protein n=1 Tax=Roseateles amylovorans TaxID=2978473 RepID=A0ABY6B5Z4_9BURK|nr:hypothetical protein [Roseateles amylovorans]UXH79748.1 hypothetical protein N4261_07530 [Roseateles amylovorans]
MDETSSPSPEPTPAPTATATPAAPATPWEGPTPDVVAWTLVNWHNRHPLARRIGIADVHTVGAVALPFMAQPLPKEPSLEGGTADIPPPPAKRRFPWQRKGAVSGPRRVWNEAFIPGLTPDQVAALALNHGFTSAPDDLPMRRVDIANSELESGATTQSGAWPMELILLSAAIDAGPARTRVLIGRRDKVVGKRALDPIRLALAGGFALLLLVLLIWALWPASHAKDDAAHAADTAASAASASASTPLAAASPASAPGPAASATTPVAASEASASAPELEASAASTPLTGITAASSPAASAPPVTSSAAASSPEAASAPGIRSIRPSLQSSAERTRLQEQAAKEPPQPPGKSSPSASAPTSTAGSATEAEQRLNVDDAGLGQLMKRAAPGGKLVALVSLPQKTRPEAEAQLAKMKELISQTLRGSAVPNGEVFQTKEGWRAAVWPFASREEAQLINATLLARGMRARAVDF